MNGFVGRRAHTTVAFRNNFGGKTTRKFEWRPPMILLLLLLTDGRPAAATNDVCPMNASEPAPVGVRVVNDVLWAGQPERPYPPSDYRTVPGGGYVLCSCTAGTKTCVRKCCKPNMTYNQTKKCSIVDKNVGSFDNYTVSNWIRLQLL